MRDAIINLITVLWACPPIRYAIIAVMVSPLPLLGWLMWYFKNNNPSERG